MIELVPHENSSELKVFGNLALGDEFYMLNRLRSPALPSNLCDKAFLPDDP